MLLDELQRDVLEAFFRVEDRFFLTGGAALAGYHLGHRTTRDLDLFSVDDLIQEGAAALAAVSRELGASIEGLATHIGFRRYLLKRGASAVVVELVWDRAPQIVTEKPVIDGVRVDPPEEIVANKLCALLSRGEIRDLVDLRALEAEGFAVEDHIEAASRKDGGFTPAQLSWVLSQIDLGDDARLPGEIEVGELRQYLRELEERLAALSYPS